MQFCQSFFSLRLNRLEEILDKHSQVIVCEDAAYHHVWRLLAISYPRCIIHPKLKYKTACVTSAATGLRIGFAIGDEKYIKKKQIPLKSIITFVRILSYKLPQRNAQNKLFDGQYFTKICMKNNQLCQQMVYLRADSNCILGFHKEDTFYIPEKYFKDDQNGHQLTKDFAFAYYIANQGGVVYVFLLGSRFVRWAFCKTTETIQDACNRLK
ncbi:unnamed protein product (macronuclear) [Paramecium tetraurelia]|uniref:Uncharacterized protein n=1 Tax=Paramecium tetraurelia TaxID=5888 RepID=A0DUI0_PARTE|nr:uncharacterized protein GSPATT00020369001 [Paramecium tetraurelia]CAK86697.1 unnamed protein product [Paramecium tetraurelia]|eukprot:XP_001454094.1 hypothetical protein (macronuclear) [Paramecium tetraurelia strain d4-2]